MTGRVRGWLLGIFDFRGHGTTVVVLAAVLAIDQADKGAVGALAPTLERAFRISNADIGMLAGAFSIVTAIATLPAGVLADKVRRTSLLAASVALWAVAMATGALAVSFAMLLIARMFLGFVTATAGPAVVSLTGDLYPRRERARILGLIQTGEFVGIGAGFVLVGAIVSVLSWRWVFGLLAGLGVVLASRLRSLPEPERAAEASGSAPTRDDPVVAEVTDRRVEPNWDSVLDADPDEFTVSEAIHEVVKVETNVVVLVASTLGDVFFAGLKVFAVLFATTQYSLSNSTAAFLVPVIGVGAVVGLVAGGRVADMLVARNVLSGRLVVAIVGYCVASVAFIPAILTRSLVVALPLLTIGAAGLAAPNPPLDAVRLDVIHPKLWGRAESVRTLARTCAEGIAPIALGVLADHIAGGGHRGLQVTMLILLPALVANAVILSLAARTYPRDVASVMVSTGEASSPTSREPVERPD